MCEAWHKGVERQILLDIVNEQFRFTFTFQALLVKTPEQAAAVVTEGGALVVVVLKAMWHVNLKALFLELQAHRNSLNLQKAGV